MGKNVLPKFYCQGRKILLTFPVLMLLTSSISREEPAQSITIPASPDTMPGEIFQLENIVEEPNHPASAELKKAAIKRKTATKSFDDVRTDTPASEIVMETSTPARQDTIEDCLNQSLGSSLGHQLETSITSNTSMQISESSIKVSAIIF